MGPPLVRHQRMHTGAMNIAVPSSWSPATAYFAAPQGAIGMLPPTGYSQNHMHYAAQRQKWSKMTYSSSGVEVLTLNFVVLQEIPGKAKGAMVGVRHSLTAYPGRS